MCKNKSLLQISLNYKTIRVIFEAKHLYIKYSIYRKFTLIKKKTYCFRNLTAKYNVKIVFKR